MNNLNTLIQRIETLNRILLSLNKETIPTPCIYPNRTNNIDFSRYNQLIKQKELEVNSLIENNDKILFWC